MVPLVLLVPLVLVLLVPLVLLGAASAKGTTARDNLVRYDRQSIVRLRRSTAPHFDLFPGMYFLSRHCPAVLLREK